MISAKIGERNPISSRKNNALLLSKYVTITIPHETATVNSQSNDKIYNIKEQTCECPDYIYRGTYCKHLQAVDLKLQSTKFDEIVIEDTQGLIRKDLLLK